MTDAPRPRILPPVGTLIALVLEGGVAALFWPPQAGPVALGAGGLLLAAGLTLNLWAASQFRSRKTGLVPFTEATAVVRTGPFRLTRNPMYLGMVLLTLGGALLTGVWWSLLAPLLLALWIHFTYIVREERFMEASMGQPYLDYKRSVGRWLGPF